MNISSTPGGRLMREALASSLKAALRLSQSPEVLNTSIAEWLEEWHKTPDPTIKHYDSDNVNYPVSLARVWEQSVGRLSDTARELMHWLVWMAPRPAGFPLEAFKTSGVWLSFRAALSELAKASLIGWPPAADEISIHRVLQAVMRNHLSEQEKTESLDGARAIIQAALPSPEWDQKGWRLWEQLAPHCRNLLNRLQDHVLEPKVTRIMNDLAVWLLFGSTIEPSTARPSRFTAVRSPLMKRASARSIPTWQSASTTWPRCFA